MLNFISNLPKNVRSGGFSAINAAAYRALAKSFPVAYVGPIDPPVVAREKGVSKLRRLVGARGDFFFFSNARLKAIAGEVQRQSRADAAVDFFHGFTPWILTHPTRPYIAWSDASFHDYITIYHDARHFHKKDIDRIEKLEAAWLKNAERVLFTNDWAAHRATQFYGLDSSRVGSVGIFGEMELPSADAYTGINEFAFIATNFERKGGRAVVKAFRRVKELYPDVTLTVVGDKPRNISEPGISFVGFLRKENPSQLEAYRSILSRARAVVNATVSDISPLLPVEAGYFGCPAISSRRYAIPELIDDDRTGILLDDPSNIDEIVAAMTQMITNDDAYFKMRRAVWKKAREQHSRQGFEDRLLSEVLDVITRVHADSITTAP